MCEANHIIRWAPGRRIHSSSVRPRVKNMEKELHEFFGDCRKQEFSAKEMRTICQPLIWQIRLAKVQRWLLLLLPLFLVCLLWLYCDTFAWWASAFGRLLLVQVLPFWDWTPHYNGKCLIPRGEQRVVTQAPALGRHETLWENCVLCESLEGIATASNVSYSMLESQFLERGLPVIVTDIDLTTDLDSLLWLIDDKAPEVISSEACDVSSNLLLRKLFSVDAALQKIRSLQAQPSTAWHLQLRNCQWRAVKASRLFLERPYFYPLHLEPYYSSWLLISHQQWRPQAEIDVRGLVFIQQLSGHFELELRPKEPCDDGQCPRLMMRLNAGEGMLFSTDLWRLSYGLQKPDPKQSSIASIFEVDWQL
ncbi:uncharacterized protein LOC108160615 [Drosophila miranda]|uniref:uncharacterized protein LOC108160615 n=1 Tax=Drosophila miranda TaxID=7229 RepID=UPI0007E68FF5|nr:uncharacterized protein LOC108160615 [Drosophila miranda]